MNAHDFNCRWFTLLLLSCENVKADPTALTDKNGQERFRLHPREHGAIWSLCSHRPSYYIFMCVFSRYFLTKNSTL